MNEFKTGDEIIVTDSKNECKTFSTKEMNGLRGKIVYINEFNHNEFKVEMYSEKCKKFCADWYRCIFTSEEISLHMNRNGANSISEGTVFSEGANND